jgi:hypothetical protein
LRLDFRHLPDAIRSSFGLGVFTIATTPLIFAQTSPTFTLFPKLPPELRLKIWRLSIPQEQKVVISEIYTYCGTSVIKGGRQQSLYGYVTKLTGLAPGIL